jgi:hypothetical protein
MATSSVRKFSIVTEPVSAITNLKFVRGKEPIIAWQRNTFTSMPHLRSSDSLTRCGHEVHIGHGVTAIMLTSITTEMMLGLGCGHCTRIMMNDLKSNIRFKNTELKDKWNKIMSMQDWIKN